MLPLIFIAIAAVTLVGAIGVVTARNLFHAALFLVLSFFGVAGIFITLEAEFLGVAQVLIYVGAISILIIFAIMLSRGIARTAGSVLNAQWAVVAIGAMLLFALLVVLLLQINWPVVQAAAPPDAIAELGRAFVDEYVIPFEVASVLLVVALIGAIIIARERES
jgi:NADH-quinone oxidoreductase subunit J